MNTVLLAEDVLFGANRRGIIIFGFQIYYYALCIVTGMIVAAALSMLMMKRRNVSPDIVLMGFIICIPCALLGARLFYCITDGMKISLWFNWDSIREGGLSILGGLIGGVLSVGIFCYVKKINFLRVADCVTPTILLAQAIGRWGNFFNQEVYGFEVTNPALQWFPFSVFIEDVGEWHYALFFYEGVLNVIGFALLYLAAWKWHKKPNGVIGFSYFVWYGIVRAIMEPFRDPGYILGSENDVMWSQITSILMIVAGVVAIGVLLYFNYRKEGALIGSKTGDACAITKYVKCDKNDVPYFSKINVMGANYPPAPVKEKKKRSSQTEEKKKRSSKEEDRK